MEPTQLRVVLAGPSPAEAPPGSEKDKYREEETRFWREKIEAWDWLPITERLKEGGSLKLGSRRALMTDVKGVNPQWLPSLPPPALWVEEWCFDTAFRQVAAEYDLQPRIDEKHGFWVSRDRPEDPS